MAKGASYNFHYSSKFLTLNLTSATYQEKDGIKKVLLT